MAQRSGGGGIEPVTADIGKIGVNSREASGILASNIEIVAGNVGIVAGIERNR